MNTPFTEIYSIAQERETQQRKAADQPYNLGPQAHTLRQSIAHLLRTLAERLAPEQTAERERATA